MISQTKAVAMRHLCMTDKTLYALDEFGNVWFIDMKDGEWALHGNPTHDDLNRLLKKMEGK